MVRLPLKEALAQMPENPFNHRAVIQLYDFMLKNYKKMKFYCVWDLVSEKTYAIFEWPHNIDTTPFLPKVDSPSLIWHDTEIKVDEYGYILSRKLGDPEGIWYVIGRV